MTLIINCVYLQFDSGSSKKKNMLPDESGNKSDIQLQENPDAIVRSYTCKSQ